MNRKDSLELVKLLQLFEYFSSLSGSDFLQLISENYFYSNIKYDIQNF